MKIVLLGFMGSGKSSVGRALGSMLDIPAIEMDDEVVRLAGGRSIREIIETEGEEHFRALERDVARAHALGSSLVIASGGGVIEHPDTMSALSANEAILTYLETPFEIICERLAAGKERDIRPLFQSPEQARTLFTRRRGLYEAAASVRVSTAGKSVLEIAEEISKLVRTSNS